MALGMRFTGKEAYGWLRWKMTEASSGASMEVTMRRAPCFGDLLAGFLRKSNVALTSAEVSARPS